MTMSQTLAPSYQLALTRGDDQVVLTFTEWWEYNKSPFTVPTLNKSFSAIAIHPLSTVHEVALGDRDNYLAQGTAPNIVNLNAAYNGLVRADWILQPTRPTQYYDTYVPVDATEDDTFGPDLGLDANGTARFITPTLKLIGYMREAPSYFPIRRADYLSGTGLLRLPAPAGTPTPGYILTVHPVGGRRRATVVVYNDDPTYDCKIWVSGVVTGRGGYEEPLAAAVTGANERTIFEIENMNTSFLMVKGTAIDVGAGPGFLTSNVGCQLYITD